MIEEYQEDQALSNLDESNMNKLINSLKSYLENSETKAYNILVYENLIELNDNLDKIGYGYYPGFQSLLVKVLKLLEQIRVKCKNDNLEDLVKDAISLINKLFKNYGYEVPEYPYGKYKYPGYDYEKPKDQVIAEKYAKEIMNRNIQPLSDIGAVIARDISDVHNGIKKQPLEEIENPEITSYLIKALERINRDKEEYEARKEHLKQINQEKTTFLSKEQEINNWRKAMLSKVIDQLISEGRG